MRDMEHLDAKWWSRRFGQVFALANPILIAVLLVGGIDGFRVRESGSGWGELFDAVDSYWWLFGVTSLIALGFVKYGYSHARESGQKRISQHLH